MLATSKGLYMSAEANPSVEEAVPQEEVTQPAQEAVQDKPKESAEEIRHRNDVEYNWAEARRKMQELERQNRELADKVTQIQQPKQVVEEDELDKLADDDIITKGHAKKLAAKMAQQIAEQVVKQREASTIDERLSVKFPDFAQVVSKENIELLKEQEPELALTLYHNPDPYGQGVAAYKLLKKLGIGGDVPKNEEKEKALKNAQKPVSVNAVTKQSAIGNAHLFENGLTKDLKAQLWTEMQEARKRL